MVVHEKPFFPSSFFFILFLSSPQVVVHEGRILEKPRDADEARRFIAGYGRAPAVTIGALRVTRVDAAATAAAAAEGGIAALASSFAALHTASVYFDAIPAEVAEAVIAEGRVMGCAGGLCIEHPLIAPLITKREGSMDNVMGMDSSTVDRLLVQALTV